MLIVSTNSTDISGICVQNPNELDAKKVLHEFDHVKKGLQLDDEGIIQV